MKVRAVVLLLLFFVGNVLLAQTKKQHFIYEKDLSQSLYYYDLLDDVMLPLIKGETDKNVLYLSLKKEDFEGRSMKISPTTLVDLYCNESFVCSIKGDTVLDLSYLLVEDRERYLFAFYNEIGVSFDEEIWLVNESKDVLLKQKIYQNQGIERFQKGERTSIYVVLILVFAVLGYLRYAQSPYFLAYFDITKFAFRAGIEDFIYINPFTGQSILLLFLGGLLYSIGFLHKEVSFGFVEQFKGLDLFVTGGVVLFAVFFKFAYLFLVNFIFGDKRVYKIHFFEFARFFMLFGIAFFVLSIRGGWVLTIVLIGVYLLWLFWLLLELIKKSSYRNVYLFSYLCISEIFPVLFLIKFMGGFNEFI